MDPVHLAPGHMPADAGCDVCLGTDPVEGARYSQSGTPYQKLKILVRIRLLVADALRVTL